MRRVRARVAMWLRALAAIVEGAVAPAVDAFEASVLEWVRGREVVTISEVIAGLRLPESGRDRHRVVAVLERSGWRRGVRRLPYGDRLHRVYCKAA